MADALAWLFVAFGVLWVVCGALAYGYNTAYFTKRWPEIFGNDRLSLSLALLGPIGLSIAVRDDGTKYGLLFRRRRWLRQRAIMKGLEK